MWTQFDFKQRSYWHFNLVAIVTENWATMATRYMADVQGTPIQHMNSIRLNTKQLLKFYSGCHGNWVTVATRYVLMPFIPRKLHTKCELNSTVNNGVTDISLWLPWYLSYHSNEVHGCAYHSKEPPYQTLIRFDLRLMSYWGFTLAAMTTKLP